MFWYALVLVVCVVVLMGLAVGWWRCRTRAARAHILYMLADGPAYGLDLVNRSAGKLHRGTVYVHLRQLEEEGLIRSWTEPGDMRRGYRARRMYALIEEN